jgi:hypothetical protein
MHALAIHHSALSSIENSDTMLVDDLNSDMDTYPATPVVP